MHTLLGIDAMVESVIARLEVQAVNRSVPEVEKEYLGRIARRLHETVAASSSIDPDSWWPVHRAGRLLSTSAIVRVDADWKCRGGLDREPRAGAGVPGISWMAGEAARSPRSRVKCQDAQNFLEPMTSRLVGQRIGYHLMVLVCVSR